MSDFTPRGPALLDTFYWLQCSSSLSIPSEAICIIVILMRDKRSCVNNPVLTLMINSGHKICEATLAKNGSEPNHAPRGTKCVCTASRGPRAISEILAEGILGKRRPGFTSVEIRPLGPLFRGFRKNRSKNKLFLTSCLVLVDMTPFSWAYVLKHLKWVVFGIWSVKVLQTWCSCDEISVWPFRG